MLIIGFVFVLVFTHKNIALQLLYQFLVVVFNIRYVNKNYVLTDLLLHNSLLLYQYRFMNEVIITQ